MKFKTPQDKELFLQEYYEGNYEEYLKSRLLNEDIENTLDAQKYISKKRQNIVRGLKNFRKSQAQKASWRANRYSYLKGIREFTRSVEGKQFHRKLSRYLVSRGILRKSHDPRDESLSINRYEAPDFLVSLSSCKTHMLIETRYYQTLSDEVDYFLLLETMIEKINDLESRILESMTNYDEFILTEDDKDFLKSIIGESEDAVFDQE